VRRQYFVDPALRDDTLALPLSALQDQLTDLQHIQHAKVQHGPTLCLAISVLAPDVTSDAEGRKRCSSAKDASDLPLARATAMPMRCELALSY
jgi:hypothetical protein